MSRPKCFRAKTAMTKIQISWCAFQSMGTGAGLRGLLYTKNQLSRNISKELWVRIAFMASCTGLGRRLPTSFAGFCCRKHSLFTIRTQRHFVVLLTSPARKHSPIHKLSFFNSIWVCFLVLGLYRNSDSRSIDAHKVNSSIGISQQ